MALCTIQTDTQHDVTIVRIRDVISDRVDAIRFQEEVMALIESGAGHIVLDLSGVRWPCRAMLGVLTTCLIETREAGNDLILASVPQDVLGILETTRLRPLFEVTDTVGEARSRLRHNMEIRQCENASMKERENRTKQFHLEGRLAVAT